MKNIACGHCIKGIKGKPVNISLIEKYVNIWARENSYMYIPKREKSNNKKVAIIGTGPAGIECSIQLAKKGFDVTIFEKEPEIGGLLTYGIPGFRLPRDITKNLTKRIDEFGINIRTNVEFGKDITIKSLKKQNFEAIFIAIGADIASSYCLCENKCESIYKSNYILKEYNAKRIIENLGDVIVIGGGNVATDSARAAMRMGAKSSTIVYRRDKDKMPARAVELDEAINDGVKVIYNTKVVKANIQNDQLEKIKCIKTDTTTDNVLDIPNTEFYLKANTIIFAIGLVPDNNLLKKEEIKLENGLIKVDENGMTNIEGVFAGGDVSQNKATVCMAIKSGKKSAEGIIKFLKDN